MFYEEFETVWSGYANMNRLQEVLGTDVAIPTNLKPMQLEARQQSNWRLSTLPSALTESNCKNLKKLMNNSAPTQMF